MTWCSRRRGGTTAAQQFVAENVSNDSADLIRACHVLKPSKKYTALVRSFAQRCGETAGAHGLQETALSFGGIPRVVHSKNRPSSSG
jgi:hypothetical protein